MHWGPSLLLLLLFLAVPTVVSLSYRCDGDRILIVQSFGNNTIRMHCQTLSICSKTNLKCKYESNQEQCGGKDNFVAHVEQNSPTGPVMHKCCQLESRAGTGMSFHDGNDCFVYELPDGITRRNYSDDQDINEKEIKALSEASGLPDTYNNYDGYRLRLYLLKNKSKAKLLVKGIQRQSDGYRVTICQPRCDDAITHERRALVGKKKLQNGRDWIIATWTAWSSSKYASVKVIETILPISQMNIENFRWTQWSRSGWGGDSGGADVRIRTGSKHPNLPGITRDTATRKLEQHLTETVKSEINSKETNEKSFEGEKHEIIDNTSKEQLLNGGINGKLKTVETEQTRTWSSRGSGEKSNNQEIIGKKTSYGINKKTSTEITQGLHSEVDRRINQEVNNKVSGNATAFATGTSASGTSASGTSGSGASGSGTFVTGTSASGTSGPGPFGTGAFGTSASGLGTSSTGASGTGIFNAGTSDAATSGNEAFVTGEPGNGAIDTGKARQGSAGTNGNSVQDGDSLKGSSNIGGSKSGEGKKGDSLVGNFEKNEIIEGNVKPKVNDGVAETGKVNSSRTPQQKSGEAKEDSGDRKIHVSSDETTNAADSLRPVEEKKNDGDYTMKKNDGEVSTKKDLSKEKSDNELKAKLNTILKNDGVAEKSVIKNGSRGTEVGDRNTVKSSKKTLDNDGDSVAQSKASANESHSGNGSRTTVKPVKNTGIKNDRISSALSLRPVSNDAKSKDSFNGGTVVLNGKQAATKLARTNAATTRTSTSTGTGTGAAKSKTAKASSGSIAKAAAASSTGSGTATGSRTAAVSGSSVRSVSTAGSGRAAAPAVGATPRAAATNCFSGDSTVRTPWGEVMMSDLKVGDLVLVPASGTILKYERVEMFYHREPETRAKFIVLSTESGKVLSLTELHLLPIGSCKTMNADLNVDSIEETMRRSIFAYKAREGDCVLSVDEDGQLKTDRILKVGRKYAKGIYAPITVEGSIVADGILTSCFSHLESHFVQKLAHDFYILLYNGFGFLMNSIDDPVQHLSVYIDSLHQLSKYVLPFAKY